MTLHHLFSSGGDIALGISAVGWPFVTHAGPSHVDGCCDLVAGRLPGSTVSNAFARGRGNLSCPLKHCA